VRIEHLRRVITALLVAILGVGILGFAIWWEQERIVFQPSPPPYPDGAPARRVEFRTSDGTVLYALVVGDSANAAAHGAVLMFHGNADLAAWRVPWAREVARRTGRMVVLAEYRGYGGNPGPPTVAGVRHGAEAALAWTREATGLPMERIALYGHSLGSAVAAELAARHTPEALLLESPFSSARDMARIIIAAPLERLWRLVSRVHYDTEERVRRLDAPVWVAHGTDDLIIPFRMGRAVYDAAKRKGEMLPIEGAGHNDVPETGGEAYWGWLTSALTRS
jgi:fermentation-respiration switch protein FrsA (DUF1100 family)